MTTEMLAIEGLNPMPWQSPRLGTIRKGGKIVPTSRPSDEVVVYQEAVKEAVMDRYPNLELIDHGLHGLVITFWFWRSLNFGGQIRRAADATNMQKCLEDALQGVVYVNDRFNRTVTSHVVAQERDIEPLILISVERYDRDPFADTRQFAERIIRAQGD